jgi:hypothetical protein
MRHPDTPGAYLQRTDRSDQAIVSLRTDIPAFVGIAERGPLDAPVAVESFRQFQAVFGGFIGSAFLAYSVRAFFENGGRRTRIVRIASRDPAGGAAAASYQIPALGGGLGWTIAATSPGTWGNALAVSVLPKARAETATDPAQSTSEWATVANTAGIGPATLVRIRQGAATTIIRIVAATDTVSRRLYWINPEPTRRRPWEQPVTGLDPNQPVVIESIDYDVLLWMRGRLAAVYQQLSLVPQHARYAPVVLAAPDYAGGIPSAPQLVTVTAPELAANQIPVPLDVVPDAILVLAGGRDGLTTLTPDDFIGDPFALPDATGSEPPLRGLASLADVREVAMLAVPDILVRPVLPPLIIPEPVVDDPCPPCGAPAQAAVPVAPVVPEMPPVFDDEAVFRVQAAMIAQAESRRDRVALLDPPFDVAERDRVGVGPVLAWRNRFDSAFGALYFPWLKAPDPLHLAPTRAVPPSGHVAGQIAATDLSTGVHQAPANVDLAWVQDATISIDAATHGLLNTAGVNVIRAEFGRLLRILGARTVSSDPTFRFLNVRRLLSMIRVALDLSTQWAVFEPNDDATRNTLTAALRGFLSQLWSKGALVGPTPDAAYIVRCDETNNPPERRANGELHADVAIAPSAPFEFIVLRLGRSADLLEIVERGSVLPAGVQ